MTEKAIGQKRSDAWSLEQSGLQWLRREVKATPGCQHSLDWVWL